MPTNLHKIQDSQDKEDTKGFTSIEDRTENLSIEEENAKIIATDPIRLHGLLPVVTRLEKELIGCKIILGWSYISQDSIENFELRVQTPKTVQDDSIAREEADDRKLPMNKIDKYYICSSIKKICIN